MLQREAKEAAEECREEVSEELERRPEAEEHLRGALREVQRERGRGDVLHRNERRERRKLDRAQSYYERLSEEQQESFRARLEADLDSILDDAIDPERESLAEREEEGESFQDETEGSEVSPGKDSVGEKVEGSAKMRAETTTMMKEARALAGTVAEVVKGVAVPDRLAIAALSC